MKGLVKKVNGPKTKAEEFAKAIIECEEYNNFIRYVLFVFRKDLKFIEII